MKLALALILVLIATEASAAILDDFEGGDANWAQVTWFDPGDYTVTANWSVSWLDAAHGNVYVGTEFGNALAYREDVWGSDLALKASLRMSEISHGGAHSAVAARFDPATGTGYHFSIRTAEVGPGQYDLQYVLVSMDGWPNDNHELEVVSTGIQVADGGSSPWMDLEIRTVGSLIECYVNSSLVLSVVDSTWTAGTVGVLSETHCDWGSACHVTLADNVTITDLTPVPATPTTWGKIKTAGR